MRHMAESDFALGADALSSSATTANPVTSAVVALPNGNDGDFVLGIHSITNDPGVVFYYSTSASFAPAAKGGTVHLALQKGASAGDDKHSPFIFLGLGGTGSTSRAYMLGLDEGATPRLALRKGSLAAGLPAVAPGSQGVLRRSSSTFSIGAWLHLRLDAILQPNGDVTLKVFQSDLGAHSIQSPVWTAVTGMADFTDDAGGINSSLLGITGTESLPLTSGRMGWGTKVADANRNSYFARVGPERQILP